MRLLVTADLHYDHAHSQVLAGQLIDEMNTLAADALLVVGDTATSRGDALEQCLSRFTFPGPKLFVAGNHELWTTGDDSYGLYRKELPRRVESLGWQWLDHRPFLAGGAAIVGSIGWYDYSFASETLAIPRRFYEQKISPGAVAYLKQHPELLERTDDLAPGWQQIVARWNDGKYIHLGRSDEAFLDELLDRLSAQLSSLAHIPHVVTAIHHLPFRELLPPSGNIHRDFAHAYLGSQRIGQILLKYPNVRHVLCGHSHFPAAAQIGHITAINLGSGYRKKAYRMLELPP